MRSLRAVPIIACLSYPCVRILAIQEVDLGGKANTDTSTCHSHSYSSTDSCLMVFVILQIRCAARVLKLWYGCSVPDTSSVADIYTDYSSGVLDNDKPVPEEYLKWARIVRIWHRSVEAVWQEKLSAPIKKLVTKCTWQFKHNFYQFWLFVL